MTETCILSVDHTEFEQLSSAVMKSDPYQGERWGGDVVFILSPSTYFDALVEQLKVQEYTFFDEMQKLTVR
jgi:hypothetical protein